MKTAPGDHEFNLKLFQSIGLSRKCRNLEMFVMYGMCSFLILKYFGTFPFYSGLLLVKSINLSEPLIFQEKKRKKKGTNCGATVYHNKLHNLTKPIIIHFK